MSRDTILRDEDGQRYSYDNIKTQGWLDGHVPGAEAVITFLRNRAVEAFQRGMDDEAKALRTVADAAQKVVPPKLEGDAKRHARDYPERLPDSETEDD